MKTKINIFFYLKIKLPATLEVVKKAEMSPTVFGAIVTASVIAIVAAVVTLIIARRHAKAGAKLAGLTTPDPEASKDYQDLCRARMHAKQPADKPESPRITNLSRENESNNSPSNRSSTSSWGEEPAPSNMDISTGQMVLVSRYNIFIDVLKQNNDTKLRLFLNYGHSYFCYYHKCTICYILLFYLLNFCVIKINNILVNVLI